MNLRILAAGTVCTVAVLLASSCSSDSNDSPKLPLAATAESTNVAFSFDASKDLPSGQGNGWQWAPPSENDVRALADRLGISGEVSTPPADQGGGWRVGSDESVPLLQVEPNGSWVVSTPIVVSDELAACLESVDQSNASAFDACNEQVNGSTPPVPLPSYDVVLEDAKQVFGPDAIFTPGTVDETTVTVDVQYLVDGEPSGLYGYLGVSAADFSSASPNVMAGGLLGTPTLVGPYPTMSASEAVERLNDPRFSYSVFPADTPPVDGSSPVELVSVVEHQVSFYGRDGEAMSLPGYEFEDANGGSWFVISVTDKFFETVPQEPSQSLPPSIPPDTPTSDPSIPSITVPTDPSDPASEPPATLPDIVGLSELEATASLEAAGFTVRIAARDGEDFILTQDYRTDRVNLVVDGGVVTNAEIG